ncbi:ABCB1 [Bugula neritina]|uniref:ABCB1 n=1 Tax=Bugula neritina TaxID=10212 RepID=A0A7J7JVR9_BUGNE|nr:ABCB1 [Bugula neritina]
MLNSSKYSGVPWCAHGVTESGQCCATFENFANARAAASTLFKCIDAEVEIDSNSEEGLKPDKLEGSIEFTGVYFTYPARPDVQLLQRFYECAAGKILIDGKDLRDYNLTWLRNYMGIVSQEPVLFASTIAENIKLGAKWGDEITQTQVETAAKEANCYDFITSLPQGFETMVGDRGVQLSGGQKQRIAIARALVRNPAILLLDEATSALDTQSEAIVQDALDKASQGRTTIVIAHRLSTVKGANKIFAFKEGKVCEEGTHDELMSDEGLYYSLVRQQLQRQEKEEQELKTKTLLRTLSSEGAAVSTSLAHIGDTASPSHMHKPLSLTCLDVDAQPGEPDAPIQFERPTSPAPLDSLAPNLRRSKRLGSTRSMTSAMSESFVFGVVPFKDAQYEFELEEAAEDKNYSTSDEDLAKQPKTGFLEILKMSQPDWHFIVVGSIAAIFTGCIQPAFALLLSEILGILSEPDPATQVAEVSSAVGYIMLVGVIATIATILQNSLFSASGDRLTVRLRKAMFATIVKQDIAFFDVKTNGVGYLINRLANQTSLVKGAAGVRIGVMIQVAATIIAALAISFAYVWELTLTVLLFLPVIALTSKLQHRLIMGHSEENKKSTEEGSQMAQEVISNMRTVTSLNRQRYFVDKFYRHFKMVYKQDMKQAFIYGIAYGVSQAMIPFMFALCFGFGGYLSVCECLPWRSQKIPFFYIFRVFAAMTFGSMSIGRATSTLPDFGKATAAAFSIRRFLEKVSAIDPSSETGAKPKSCEGKVEFSDVKFSYPSRESVQVLKGLNFTIKTGETLALVGASGCGKSTSVALLERFYDPTSGSVAIDGNNIRSLNVQWLRKNLGLVSQEPTLFDASIAYNIAYGDNEREVPMSEVIEAARKANAHDFIASLPQGYQTNVGAKGTQLSGGQKQRIAIARALVRNPAILLLDEATSALDVQSEKIVQDALEAAMSGRTAIIIAHRLSTIRNAKKIGVIDNGEIVELGTHDQLLSARGFYYNLVNYQL